VLAAAGKASAGSAGYLPVIGPGALQFQAPVSVKPPFKLPPLDMSAPPSAAGSSNSAAALEAEAAWSELLSGLLLSGASAASAPAPSPQETAPSAPSSLGMLLSADAPDLIGTVPSAIITPQMLIQFFKPTGTNQPLPGLVTPVFTPPIPPALSSTAVYRSQ